MITLVGSLQTALTQTTLEPRQLVELDGPTGTYRLAQEAFVWGGQYYFARLAAPVAVQLDAGGTVLALAAARQIEVRVADPDGFFGAMRPETFRGRSARVRTVLREVDSEALSDLLFRVTAVEHDGTYWTVRAEDQWAEVRRRRVPATFLTRSMYPQLPPEADGQPLPWVFGRTFVPLTLVDEVTEEESIFAACTGSANAVGSVTVVEIYNGETFVVTSARIVAALRNGVPLTEVWIRSPIRVGGTGEVPPKFCELQSYHGSEYLLPSRVLLDLLTREDLGNLNNAATALTVDSVSLVATDSFHMVNSIGFVGFVQQPVTVGQLLGQWGHDAMTHVLLRDELALVPQASRSAVASFAPNNIVLGGARYADTPEDAADERRTIVYRDRTLGFTTRTEQVGSGAAELLVETPFIGTPSVARKAGRFWGRVAGQVRRYDLPVTLRHAALEPGDLVTITRSQFGVTAQLGMVETITTDDYAVRCAVREMVPRVFSLEPGEADPPYRRRAQQVRVPSANSWALTLASNCWGVTVSHQLLAAPAYAQVAWVQGWAGAATTASLTAATASTATVRIVHGGGLYVGTIQLPSLIQWIGLRVA